MRIHNLEELRKIHREIKEKEEKANNAEIQTQEAMVLAAFAQVLELHRIARLEGLLSLEEMVEGIDVDAEEEYLKQLIMLVVDGTDTEIIEGIGWSRYFANDYTDYPALQHLIWLEGVLSIQAGDNLRVLEEKLKGMLPSHLYRKMSKEKEMEQKQEAQEKEAHLIENLCKGERLWNRKENGYFVSKLLDYVLCDMTDMELQRLMRETENSTIELAMKGMSGAARKRIFDNLSTRLAKLIAADISCMGPVRMVDISDASQRILTSIIELIDAGEIAGRYEYLVPFYQLVSVDTKSLQQKPAQIHQLKKMVEEFEQASGLMKEYIDV